ncbi:hypothetical protein EJ05DRAFT_99208 [Pseudovirgaria hyperparasitica]|uniref:Protein DOM34 homolog n=1 Tax=Pseudovirgaria hyperparasitica TaxID=470096 RepID=A0A6A6VXG0_9PEZI|nr:uncharacterized protein EJ05DRAFT_99208 [Pseudovirgaria hyperparasitica]KAF2755358.1 hypothetical protein EJ05DRAFT_99208 [Pseudovirgaria hyperparasitica]
MRNPKKDLNARDAPYATLIPEDPEDMWHCYNLIQPSDLLRASAIRKVNLSAGNSNDDNNGSSRNKRVHITLTIRVRSIDFDPAAAQLHVNGQVVEENEHVPLGSHHTLDLELQRAFTLSKPGGGGWDSVARQILAESTESAHKAVVWAVVMQEGKAQICHITEHQTVVKASVEVSVPRKRVGGAAGESEKGMERFFEMLLGTLLRYIDLSVSAAGTPLLLASPGFVASSFQGYMKKQAVRTGNRPLLQLLQKNVIVTYASSGHLHALNEVLASPAIKTRLADTKFARETGLMDKFFTMLRLDDGRAWYGPREIERAVDQGAVGSGGGILLINDTLFRANNVAERKRWVSLVDRVASGGGEVRKLSSMHESGKRLESLGNIAAILTYPLEDLDEEEEEEEGEDQAANDAIDTQQL